ncbi:hypothetical protein CLOSYM_01830 [[Clostridium] symbiosum ATCC 14940]|uniref:Uncharacterized protein n=1 Tax=[Clostridium] symbiosum ATCC 14940 TaxID=411472 RepID=A0ABC9TZ83_CLOSY|nr:hypothetical protein CLOSYM_01830 [[Clostridium] symbiosum ATCC 14940]
MPYVSIPLSVLIRLHAHGPAVFSSFKGLILQAYHTIFTMMTQLFFFNFITL